jgi:hypothetical protein
MKRRIDIQQLNELTEEQKQKLREWWMPEEGDRITTNFKDAQILYDDGEYQGFSAENKTFINYIPSKTHEMYPLLDIGQMIELLDCAMNKIEPMYNEGNATKEQESKLKLIYQISGKMIFTPNLCDTLWKTIKNVL